MLRPSPCWPPSNRSTKPIVTKICAINTDNEAIVSRFPKIFSGLGSLTEEYQVKLNEDDATS